MDVTKKSGIKGNHQLNLDVSGKKGADARDGSRGMSGRDGTDATHAEDGGDAGDLQLKLQADAFGSLHVTGQAVDDGNRQSVDTFVAPGGSVQLKAHGGGGGEGGDGGAGGDGSDGRRGSDATRYSSGGNGENGEDGGDGGRGTSGARGGRGGKVQLDVGASDTDLLALVDGVDVSGGKGGAKGSHGAGGRGGDGGAGGSSHSWTETEGSGENQRTTHHSNSGGSRGWDGSRGNTPSTPLSDGEDGRRGSFEIRVKGDDGATQTYDDRYRVKTSKVTAKSGNDDGVIEPGETVHVTAQVTNTSAMPTPKAQSLFTLRSNELVGAVKHKDLKGVLAQGETHDVSGVAFQVPKNDTVADGERLNVSGVIDPRVQLVRAGRELDEARAPTPFQVSYPVEISPIVGDRTATLERAAQVAWKVTNISTKPLGETTDCQRMVQSYMKRIGGDAPVESLLFTSAKGETLPLAEGIGRALEKLAPGDSVEIKGSISFKKDAPAYSAVHLRLGLALDDVNDNALLREIQQRTFSVQLAREYASDPNAGLLLVVNNRTGKEEIAAWEQLARELGTHANVWNLSLYGGVSLTDAIGDANLGKDFAGKTAIVLNNAYDAVGGVGSAEAQLADDQSLKAAVASRLTTYFVGGQVDIAKHLDATGLAGDGERHADVKAFLEAENKGGAGVAGELGRDTVEVFGRGAPTQKDIERAADKLKAKLVDMHPERRHDVEFQLSRDAPDSSFLGMFKKQKVGTVRITRSMDINRHVISHMNVDSLHDPSFVLSASNKYALVKAMPFDKKLAALGTATTPDLKAIVKRAVLSDLAEEQQVMRQEVWDAKMDEADAAKRLHRLNAFSTMNDAPLAVELATHLQHMMSQATTLWDRVLPFRARDTVSDASTEVITAMLTRLFPDKAARQEVIAKMTTEQQALKAADDAQIEGAQSKDERRALKAADRSMMEYLQPAELHSANMASDFTSWRAR